MNISKSKTGAYVCNYKEAHTYVLVDAMKDKKRIVYPHRLSDQATFSKNTRAQAFWVRSKNGCTRTLTTNSSASWKRCTLKIGEDLGIDYDCRFTY